MIDGGRKAGKQYAYRAIIDRIDHMIRSGELRPGDRLEPERKLAERFGVSRSSLRQAFQTLAERKIIESRQGDGTYLLATLETGAAGANLLAAISAQSGFVQDILEFRRIMEPQIAALAATRIRPEDLDRLKVLVCDQQRSLLGGRTENHYDAEFHRLLVRIADNAVISQVMSTLQASLDQSRTVWLQSSERCRASVEGHLRIIDGLEAGDAEAARQAMQEHLDAVETLLFGDERTGEDDREQG